jgi:hypothetical protein
LAVLSFLLIMSSAAGFAVGVGEQRVVEGVGAIVQRNQAAARARAVRSALRKALEQVVAELLDPFVLVDNLQGLEKRLYTQALKYIRSYRVLWEYPDASQKVYRVNLEVEVAVDEVVQEIQALGLGQRGGGRSRLLIFVVEHRLGRTQLSTFGGDGGVVAQVLRTQLQAQGLHVMRLGAGTAWDGRESSALVLGKEVGADVVLVGQARVQKVRNEVAGMSLQAVQARVQVQALTTATGEQLALERAEATALHTDAILGGTQALEKAAAKVAARLVSPLRAYRQDQERAKTLQSVQ